MSKSNDDGSDCFVLRQMVVALGCALVCGALLPVLEKVVDFLGDFQALGMGLILVQAAVWLDTLRSMSKLPSFVVEALFCLIVLSAGILAVVAMYAPDEKPQGPPSSAPEVTNGAQQESASPTTATSSKPALPPLRKVPINPNWKQTKMESTWKDLKTQRSYD